MAVVDPQLTAATANSAAAVARLEEIRVLWALPVGLLRMVPGLAAVAVRRPAETPVGPVVRGVRIHPVAAVPVGPQIPLAVLEIRVHSDVETGAAVLAAGVLILTVGRVDRQAAAAEVTEALPAAPQLGEMVPVES